MSTGSPPLVLLLHGYGQQEDTAARFARALPTGWDSSVRRGPLDLAEGARAWFPAGLAPEARRDAAATTTRALLAELEAEGHGERPLGVIGFSQGGAMGAHLLRFAPTRVRFVVNLSGFVVPGAVVGDAELARRRPPYHWARGHRDTQMPEPAIRASTEWLAAHTSLTERIHPDLAHDVSDAELDEVRTWIEGHAP